VASFKFALIPRNTDLAAGARVRARGWSAAAAWILCALPVVIAGLAWTVALPLAVDTFPPKNLRKRPARADINGRAVEVAGRWPCSLLLRTLRPLKSAPTISRRRIRNCSFSSAAIIAARQSDAARSLANGIILHTRICRY
jgi:hypothetical protein